jgi:hypothetical protein
VDDLDDAPLLHAKHRERERTVARFARRPQVHRERGLQVRSGGNEQVLDRRGVPVARAPERVETVVPDRARRERDARVGAHERGERREVPALEGVDIPPRDLSLLRGRILGVHPLEPPRRRAVAQPVAGALQGAVDSRHARAEERRGLARREPRRVAQDQRRPLARRQVLDRRHERDLERLPRGGGLVRINQAVRVGIEPREVGGDRRRLDLRVRRGRDVRRQQPRGAARQVVQARVVAMRYSQARNDHRPSRRNPSLTVSRAAFQLVSGNHQTLGLTAAVVAVQRRVGLEGARAPSNRARL